MIKTEIARNIGHVFTNPDLLKQALTHRSHVGRNNERLEFLGDGVLNFIIAHQLFIRFPSLAEGDLSRLRAHLVREATLSELAIKLNVGDALLLGEGELKSAGWRRPSVLADALEAIIGAVFLDAGYSAAESLIVRLFANLMENIDPKSIGKDAKSMLQEFLQARKQEVPDYKVIEISGEAHCQTFKVECAVPKWNISTLGEGTSRRMAEQHAAKLALEKIMNAS